MIVVIPAAIPYVELQTQYIKGPFIPVEEASEAVWTAFKAEIENDPVGASKITLKEREKRILLPFEKNPSVWKLMALHALRKACRNTADPDLEQWDRLYIAGLLRVWREGLPDVGTRVVKELLYLSQTLSGTHRKVVWEAFCSAFEEKNLQSTYSLNPAWDLLDCFERKSIPASNELMRRASSSLVGVIERSKTLSFIKRDLLYDQIELLMGVISKMSHQKLNEENQIIPFNMLKMLLVQRDPWIVDFAMFTASRVTKLSEEEKKALAECHDQLEKENLASLAKVMKIQEVCLYLVRKTLDEVYREWDLVSFRATELAVNALFYSEAAARLGKLDCAKIHNQEWAETLNRQVAELLKSGEDVQILSGLQEISKAQTLPLFKETENLYDLWTRLTPLSRTVLFEAKGGLPPTGPLLRDLTLQFDANTLEGRILRAQIKKYTYTVEVKAWYGPEATNADVKQILENLPHVQRLDLRDCKNVTSLNARHKGLSEVLLTGSAVQLKTINLAGLPALNISKVEWHLSLSRLKPKQRWAVESLRQLREADLAELRAASTGQAEKWIFSEDDEKDETTLSLKKTTDLDRSQYQRHLPADRSLLLKA